MTWKTLPKKITPDTKDLPPTGKLIAVCDDAGTVGTGYFTGTTFTGALCNAQITHWAALEELPRPDCYKPKQ